MTDGAGWKKFRKKPVVVRARPITAKTPVRTREGVLYGYPGDWLIEGVEGEVYPCGAAIFEKTYEEVEEEDKQ